PSLEQPATNPLNREQNQIALARIQIAGGDYREAQDTLSTLVPVAERNAHNRHLVEILLVYADALTQEGRSDEAAAMLDRALDKAESAGFLRLFAEENEAIRDMLLDLPRLRTPGRWNRELLTMLRDQRAGQEQEPPKGAPVASPSTLTQDALLEPLSHREQEVLELINQGLANKDIAVTMSVAAAAVKAQNRTLDGKVGVGRRTEALAKARELGLQDDRVKMSRPPHFCRINPYHYLLWPIR